MIGVGWGLLAANAAVQPLFQTPLPAGGAGAGWLPRAIASVKSSSAHTLSAARARCGRTNSTGASIKPEQCRRVTPNARQSLPACS